MPGIKNTGLFLTAVFLVFALAGCTDGINDGGKENTYTIKTTYEDDYTDLPITQVEDGYTILRLKDAYGFRERYGYFSSYFTEYHRGWAYVIGPDMNDKSVTFRMRPDGSDKHIVLDSMGFSGGVYHDGWYYYADQWVTIGWDAPPPSRLHRMRLDGSEKMTYENTGSVDSVAFSGEWIYYLSGNDLYRINVNGGGRIKIADGCSRFIISAGYVFTTLGGYTGGDAQYDTKIARYNLDGTGKLLLIENESIALSPVFTDGGFLYYHLFFGDSNKGGQLHRMKFDGTDIQTIVEHPSRPGAEYYTLNNFNLKDGFIFYHFYQIDRSMGGTYSNWNFISQLYKIRTDGTDHMKLQDDVSQYYNIIGDSIFFTTALGASAGDRYGTVNLNRLSINGDSHKIVYSNRGSEFFSGYFIDNNKLYVVVRD